MNQMEPLTYDNNVLFLFLFFFSGLLVGLWLATESWGLLLHALRSKMDFHCASLGVHILLGSEKTILVMF